MIINKDTLRAFRIDFSKAVADLEWKHGVKISIGTIRFNDTEFSAKLTVATPQNEAKKANSDKNMFSMFAEYYGLPADCLGKTVLIGSKRLTIEGLNTRAQKLPVVLKDVITGKKYKSSTTAVTLALGLPLKNSENKLDKI